MMVARACLACVLVLALFGAPSCVAQGTSDTRGNAAGQGAGNTAGQGAGGSSGNGCPAGTSLCDGSCVALDINPLNCGSCGTACATGMLCQAGVCGCSQGLTD